MKTNDSGYDLYVKYIYQNYYEISELNDKIIT